MVEQFALVIEGLHHLEDMEKLPQDIVRSARIAVNQAATRGRTDMGREALRQVNFPRDYVAPRNKRLYVSKKAQNTDLEAIITARSRVTSLARFAQQSTPTKRGGKSQVRVEVKSGAVRTLPGAFLIRLRAGSADLDTKSNMGLAIRTRNGLAPSGAYAPKKLGNNLWLLYGPAVSQLVYSERNNGGIATDLSPEIKQRLEDEFWRQMDIV